jgi:hypothetical protein
MSGRSISQEIQVYLSIEIEKKKDSYAFNIIRKFASSYENVERNLILMGEIYRSMR